MGVIRKSASVLTFGLIDFRSDKERTARYTKKTLEQVEEQTQLLRESAERDARNENREQS